MKLSQKDNNKLIEALDYALDLLYENDIYLIENRVHERAIIGRFLIYFQQTLDKAGYTECHLDFEYNKNHSDPKKTKSCQNGTYPDIVFHKRGSHEQNILIIEFKTWWNRNTDKDIKKLKDFTNPAGKYKYALGYSIVIEKKRTEIIKTAITKGNLHCA